MATTQAIAETKLNEFMGLAVSYHAETDTFGLTPEQALALAHEGSPAFVPGAFQVAIALTKDEEKIAQAFKTGQSVGWHEHHHDYLCLDNVGDVDIRRATSIASAMTRSVKLWVCEGDQDVVDALVAGSCPLESVHHALHRADRSPADQHRSISISSGSPEKGIRHVRQPAAA